MSPVYLGIAAGSQAFFVGGQFMLKKAMTLTTHTPVPRRRVSAWFAGAIGLMTVWYFLWLYAKQFVPISELIAVEGVNPALFVIAGLLWLHERAGWRTWAGVALVSGGIIIVALGT